MFPILTASLPRPGRVGRLVLGLTVFMLLAAPVRAAEDPYRALSLTLTQKLISLFPPAQGYVVSIPDGEVYIDLAEKDLMRPGMELLVYREGKDIVHPVSGDVLGKYEEKVGYLTLKDVHDQYSVAVAVDAAAAIKPGDRVRISSRPLRALLLFSAEAPFLETGQMARVLADTVQESKRFRLRDEPEWLPRLKEIGMTIDDVFAEASSLRRLGEETRADLLFVVAPDDRKEGGATVGLQVLSLWTGRTLADFRQPWAGPARSEAAVWPPAPLETAARQGGEDRRGRGYLSKDLLADAMSVQAGDFNGDGITDILLTDGFNLVLYSWEEGGLIWKWEEERKAGRHVLHLESGDVDGDGRVDILVTSVAGGRLKTDVLSWGRGEWDRIGGVEGAFIRVLHGPGAEGTIMGQRAGVGTVFSGPVSEYAWEEDTFSPKGSWILPRPVDIFGLGLADLDGDGETEILSLSDHGNLRVYSRRGEGLYETDDRYGGYPVRISAEALFGPHNPENPVSKGFFTDDVVDETIGKDAAQDILTAFQGRILSWREGDGDVLVALPRNDSSFGRFLPNLRRSNRGEVAVLRWNDGRLEEVHGSRRQDGYIADASLGDLDGNGRREILMLVNRPSGVWRKSKGSLVVWRIGEGFYEGEKGE